MHEFHAWKPERVDRGEVINMGAALDGSPHARRVRDVSGDPLNVETTDISQILFG